ncbi:hypothetical protein G0Q06_07510 [Puniceicoccales bacterium CK1056]|uniref:Uncharacterized protein n=1 Tax=Oceanipulchritudo coccoides TaxID=2706888 RepID=A0A6B2M3P1_9BACT|nr:hypothetical protein [Oceanipulchritudo coccoides]NDV62290.1 hypothetical protein [Oceanipulchritudo coccoides]
MTAVSNGNALLIQVLILLLGALSLVFSWWAARAASPVIAIFGRWIRWFFIASFAAGLLQVTGWTGYGFGTLLIVALLLFFVLETGYNWLAISALSKSELPLFPKFEINERGDEWPSNPAFIKLKGWLRQSGFQKRQALLSMLGETLLMRVSVYENEEQTLRLHILFLPNARGNTASCFTFYSTTQSGEAIVTDNIFLPFGGFYPESWEVERQPWIRSIDRLLQRHRARIDAKGEALMPFLTEPIEQINADQRTVEQLNRELGFLHTPAEEAEQGRLTTAGRARIWQEVWTLAYLGLSLKYS